MSANDQQVAIVTHDGARHVAIGDPDLVVYELRKGHEILCKPRSSVAGYDEAYVIRVFGPIYVRYPEATGVNARGGSGTP